MWFIFLVLSIIIFALFGLTIKHDGKIDYETSEVSKLKLKGFFKFLFPHKKEYPNEIAKLSFFSQLSIYALFLIDIALLIVSIYIPENVSLPIAVGLMVLILSLVFVLNHIYNKFFDNLLSASSDVIDHENNHENNLEENQKQEQSANEDKEL